MINVLTEETLKSISSKGKVVESEAYIKIVGKGVDATISIDEDSDIDEFARIHRLLDMILDVKQPRRDITELICPNAV